MEQDNKPNATQDCQSKWVGESKATEEVEQPRSRWRSFLLGIGFWVMLIGFVSFPWTIPILVRLESETTVERLGQVEQVSFLVGWSPMTQVRVGGKPILLHQPNEVPLGATVERRRNRVVEQLCIVETERCWDIASR